jgi:hypothetical protein
MGNARLVAWAIVAALAPMALPGSALADEDEPPAESSPTPQRAKPTGDEWAMLYLSSGIYGASAGMFVDGLAQNGNAYAGASLLTVLTVPAGIGLGVASVGIVKHFATVWRGEPQTVATGILLGLGEGVALDEWSSNRATTSFHTYTKDTAWIFGMGSLGLATGLVTAATVRTTPGRAAWVATTGLFGGIFAGSIAGALSPETSFGATGINSVGNRDVGLTSAIAGLAGAGIGLASATALSPSTLRVHLIDVGWIAGTVLPGVACASSHCEAPAVFTAMAVGGGIGFVATFIATNWMAKKGLTDGTDPFGGVTPYVAPTVGGAQFGLEGPL